MITTPNMGLTKWDLGGDAYDHSQLAANFGAIDLHDHTTGKGVKIPAGGIADGAITTSLIGLGAVTTDEILNGTILPEDLSMAFWDLAQPLGTLLTWWRPSGSVPDPETSSGGRWVLADGRVLSTANHDYDAAYGINTSITILDARNHYLLGAVLSGGGTTPGLAPNVGVSVGSHTVDSRHTHTVNAHMHTVEAHSHTLGSDGTHYHEKFYSLLSPSIKFPLKMTSDTFQTTGNLTDSMPHVTWPGWDTIYPAGGVGNTITLAMDNAGLHNHGGTVGWTSAPTDEKSPGTSDPSVDLSAVDNRPNSVGAAVFVKVRY